MMERYDVNGTVIMLDTIAVSVISLVLILSMVQPALASGLVYDPTNYVQNAATAASTAKMYYQQGSMIRNQFTELNNERIMLENTDWHHLSGITQAAKQVGNVAAQGEALTYSTENLSTTFDNKFGNTTVGQAAKQHETMLKTVLDTAKGTLNAAHQQMQAVSGETNGLNEIVTHSDNSDGTKAVLQGTNQLLDANAAQLVSIKQAMAQLQSQRATSDAARTADEEAATKADAQFLDYMAEYNGYQTESTLQSIPSFN